MQRVNGKILYSPTDLITYWESPYASWMERFVFENPGTDAARDPDSEMQKVLQRQGDAHEKAALQAFQDAGRKVCMIPREGDYHAQTEATLRAMKDGADIIFQARLSDEPFAGYADFLVRVNGKSNLGDFHYEAWDTKLARSMKTYYVLQLCLYSEMLAAVQGVMPKNFVVVLGNGKKEEHKTGDYFSYYQTVKASFLSFHASFDAASPPNPEDYRFHRQWKGHADEILEKNGSLAQVARLWQSQRQKLQSAGIHTIHDLATTSLTTVKGMFPETLARAKKQASLQLRSKEEGALAFEVVPPDSYEKTRGFWMLPPPSKHDIFFDLEGYPVADGGLEYLWGWVELGAKGSEYRDLWAHDAAQERQAFEKFVDEVYERWQKNPTMHVYHYAQYEVSVLKKLMSRHASREEKIDEMLSHHVFVDLYQVVKDGLIVGDKSYSLKVVEKLYLKSAREGDVKDGDASIMYYDQWRHNRDGDDHRSSKILRVIRDYNEVDCVSTYELAKWLWDLQTKAGAAYAPPEVGSRRSREEEIEANAILSEEIARVAGNRPEGDLLRYLLDFHARADKPVWWEYFRRLHLTTDELMDEKECIAGVERVSRPGSVFSGKRASYTFPEQEIKLREGDDCVLQDGKTKVEITKLDLDQRILELDSRDVLPGRFNLISGTPLPTKPLRKAIREYVEQWAAEPARRDPVVDILRRDPPRINGHKGGSVLSAGVKPSDILKNLDGSVLCVQGPPGAGKTTMAAEAIADLVAMGKRVAISSNSHKAINHLLERACAKAMALCPGLYAGKVESKSDDYEFQVEGIETDSAKELAEHLTGPAIIGGTAWAFCRKEFTDMFDYLFIDEASQVSLANAVAMAQATRNMVLIGDQMQLGQPMKGVHPDESGKSVLDYVMGDMQTIPDDRGIFLPTTYRLHPEICKFISEAVYEGRLKPAEGNERQKILLPTTGKAIIPEEAGMVHVPVKHEGRAQSCPEEADAIKRIMDDLLGREFQDKDGTVRRMTKDDILVVAPYNLQVNLLLRTLGNDTRVGTIDRFQGQEAPVCILSMTSSDITSGRGADFLLDLNRMNVALSRAQAMVIVVGHPGLGTGSVSSVKTMKLLNLYCRFVAEAKRCVL